MGSVRSRKFCCCIPVRFGAVMMTTLFLLGGSILAAVGWHGVTHKEQLHLTHNQEVSLVISSISHTLLALISLFGLIGCIIKRRSYISLYSTVIAFHLGFSIATGAFFIYTLFHKVGDSEINNCIANDVDDLNLNLNLNGIEDCMRGFMIYRGVLVAAYVVFWLLQLWGCVIVADYVAQLKEEEEGEELDYPPPAQTAASTPPMATTYNQYSFAQPENSFGHDKSTSV